MKANVVLPAQFRAELAHDLPRRRVADDNAAVGADIANIVPSRLKSTQATSGVTASTTIASGVAARSQTRVVPSVLDEMILSPASVQATLKM
jgi:hypothetical protein